MKERWGDEEIYSLIQERLKLLEKALQEMDCDTAGRHFYCLKKLLNIK